MYSSARACHFLFALAQYRTHAEVPKAKVEETPMSMLLLAILIAPLPLMIAIAARRFLAESRGSANRQSAPSYLRSRRPSPPSH
jgi:hypothetical protein